MNETNQKKCRICGGYLFDDDDVVVCPICGAPHHRDCYNSVGHCGDEDNHGTPLQYDKQLKKENAANGKKATADKIICPNCGNLCNQNDKFCPKCSAPLTARYAESTNNSPFSAPFGRAFVIGKQDPCGGINPKTELGNGVKASDAAAFVGIGSQRYIPRFAAFSSGFSKSSWNWAAFIFPAAWMFYRKMYFKAMAVFIIQLAASICSFPLSNAISEILPANYTQADLVSLNFLSGKLLVPTIIFLAAAVLSFTLRIIVGMFGDRIYKGHCIDKISEIKGNKDIEDEEIEITKRGGTNLFVALLSILLLNYWLPGIIYGLI